MWFVVLAEWFGGPHDGLLVVVPAGHPVALVEYEHSSSPSVLTVWPEFRDDKWVLDYGHGMTSETASETAPAPDVTS